MLIQLDHIGYKYSNTLIFSDISLTLKSWEILTIYGPSWSGKTTLLKNIGKLITPSIGQATFHHTLSDRQRSFGYGFIDGPFFEEMSVQDNILFLQHFTDIKLDMDFYVTLLERFEMQTYIHKLLRELSVGQRERVNIIRALVHRPQVVILDEPGSNLDDRLFDIVYECIDEIKSIQNTLICIATHNDIYKKISNQSITLSIHQN